ncbi:hypothetical protein [Roseiflexus sp.]
MRLRYNLGAGDFNWALKTAHALIYSYDPYAFTPSSLLVAYPLPVALFGLPLLWLPNTLAATIFFGCSSGLLAYGIMKNEQPWRLLIFLTFPYWFALCYAQWSPLIAAAWFIPVLAPLLVLIKPHIALPVAINRITPTGVVLAGLALLTSFAIMPDWLWRWLATTREFESKYILLTLPFGPFLLLAVLRWRNEEARLLLSMAVLPFRGLYDLVALYLIPRSARQMVVLVSLSWLPMFLHGTIPETQLITLCSFLPALGILFIPSINRDALSKSYGKSTERLQT